MQPPRLISRLLSYLALGALTTIAIAWSLAFVPFTSSSWRLTLFLDPHDTSPSPNGINFLERHAFGSARFEWAPLEPLDAATNFDDLRARWAANAAAHPSRSFDFFVELPYDPSAHPLSWPSVAALPHGRITATNPAAGRSTDLRGLPFPALSCSVPVFASMRTGRGPPVSWGIAIRKPTSDMQDPWTALPLRPVLPGFILDALIWSLLWLALLTGATTLRRARRLRRNLCPSCAYSRAGLAPNAPCPECGHLPSSPAGGVLYLFYYRSVIHPPPPRNSQRGCRRSSPCVAAIDTTNRTPRDRTADSLRIHQHVPPRAHPPPPPLPHPWTNQHGRNRVADRRIPAPARLVEARLVAVLSLQRRTSRFRRRLPLDGHDETCLDGARSNG